MTRVPTITDIQSLFDNNSLFHSAPLPKAPHDEVTEAYIDLIKRHDGNVDPTTATDGIYTVPNGQLISRFNMPIIPGHVYERKVVEYETWTDYSIYDLTCQYYDHWENHVPEDNRWSRPLSKTYMAADEWWADILYRDSSWSPAKRWEDTSPIGLVDHIYLYMGRHFTYWTCRLFIRTARWYIVIACCLQTIALSHIVFNKFITTV